jgi:hypothetical protein
MRGPMATLASRHLRRTAHRPDSLLGGAVRTYLPSTAHHPGPVPPGTARHTVPAQYPLAPPATSSRCPSGGQVCVLGRCVLPGGQVCGPGRCVLPGGTRGQVCPAWRHNLGRCPGVFPGSRTKSRWACGSIPADGPRRGKPSGGARSELSGGQSSQGSGGPTRRYSPGEMPSL